MMQAGARQQVSEKRQNLCEGDVACNFSRSNSNCSSYSSSSSLTCDTDVDAVTEGLGVRDGLTGLAVADVEREGEVEALRLLVAVRV